MENKKLCPYTVEVEDSEPVFTGGGVTFGAFCDTFTWDTLETYIGTSDVDCAIDEAEIPDAALVTAFYVRGDIAQVTFNTNPLPVLKQHPSFDEDGCPIYHGENIPWAEFRQTFTEGLEYDIVTVYNYSDGEEIDVDTDDIPDNAFIREFRVYAHEAEIGFDGNPVTIPPLFIDTEHSGCAPEQCGETLTVGELRALLEEYDEDTPVYFRNDGGYTYGSIRETSIVEAD